MKLPPPEKIYEAWSALASGRLASQDDPSQPEGNAVVISSSGQKEYLVRWKGNEYFSTDPATWWQGYPGYPIISVLMYRGLLPFDMEIARPFANVPWERLNKKAGGNYALALSEAIKSLALPEEEINKARELSERTFSQLSSMDIIPRRFIKTGNAAKKN